MATAKQPAAPKGYFLRAGIKANAPSVCNDFELNGIASVLTVDHKGNVKVYKRTKTGHTEKPIATGFFRPNTVSSDNAPTWQGIIRTAKDSRFQLAAWLHDDPIDPYYVIRYNQTQRLGTLVRL